MKTGFTIIELIVVIFCLNLIIIAPLANFDLIKTNFLFPKTIQEIVHDIEKIKLKAVAYSTVTEIEFNNNYIITRKQNIKTNNFEELSRKKLPKNIYFEMPTKFRFSSSGFPVVGFTGTVKVCKLKGIYRKIVLSSFGRIRIE